MRQIEGVHQLGRYASYNTALPGMLRPWEGVLRRNRAAGMNAPAPVPTMKRPPAIAFRRPFVVTCDDGSGLACNDGRVQTSLHGLGATFCTSLNTALDNMSTLFKYVPPVPSGQKSDPRVEAAFKFWDRYRGWSPVSPLGNDCEQLTSEANRHIQNLNSVVNWGPRAPTAPGAGGGIADFFGKIFGSGTGVSTVDPGQQTSISDMLGSVKTIAIAGAVIAGVVLVAPVVWRVVGR